MLLNNELPKLPGFFFCPSDTTDLVELSIYERMEIMGSGQGNYMVGFTNLSDEMQRVDLMCALDNSRIPTHKRIGVEMPAFGTVPFDLRVMIPHAPIA